MLSGLRVRAPACVTQCQLRLRPIKGKLHLSSGSFGPASSRRASCCAAEAPEATTQEAPDPLPTGSLNLRVGKIVSCERHPDADSLYVEKIDIGEDEPRTIISGLVNFVPIEDMQDRLVVIIANLKPRNMRGISSHGMVLCASDESHENVEPLVPPEGSEVGERIFFEADQKDPDSENKVTKKVWKQLQPDLRTDDSMMALWKDAPMMTSAGPVMAASLKGANIS